MQILFRFRLLTHDSSVPGSAVPECKRKATLTVQRPGKVDLVVEESPAPEHHRLALVHLGVLGQHRKLELGTGQCWKKNER